MRYVVALAVVAGLLVALPAAARQQAETVTVKVGQTVPLKTVFDKKKTYTIVMSGLVTLTLNDGGGKETYDPFHGAQAENCQNAGPGSVYLQIKDKNGPAISASHAYKPPLYRVPCRLDHRYEFQVNDGPAVSDLEGSATAYIPLQPDPRYWTASGSFKLQITEPPRRDVILKVLAFDERFASKSDPLLADARLAGAGRIVDLDGDRDVRGVFALKLIWLERADTQLTLRPVSPGTWGYNRKKRSVFGLLEVVKANDKICQVGGQWNLALRQGASDAAVLQPRRCSGIPGQFTWTEPSSTVAATVKEVKVK
jgi:hypothetical protein